jgi:hypothetical protein
MLTPKMPTIVNHFMQTKFRRFGSIKGFSGNGGSSKKENKEDGKQSNSGDTGHILNRKASTGGSNYGNANVTAYTVTMGFTNYSNVNVSALITTNGLTNYSNVNASALITTNGLTNYSNVNTKAYAESMGYQNYGNVNVAAVITTNGLTNYSNVNTAALITTNGLTNYSNVNLTAYLGGAVTIGGNLITGGARADTGYQFSKPTANVEVTANMSTTHLILAPTGTVISFGANVTLPGGNLDGRLFSITSNVATTLAVQASTGTSITPFDHCHVRQKHRRCVEADGHT